MLLNRRVFLKTAFGFCSYLAAGRTCEVFASDTELHEALYYEKMPDGRVRCRHCPHACVVEKNKRGFCRIKENKNGTFYNLAYGRPCAVHIDPIEKKPFFHVLPATISFSLATVGCNLRCKFCQNWQISQAGPEQINSVKISPREIVYRAKAAGCPSIAYTYTEPTIFYEYTLAIAKIARHQGIKNVMHSNGSINPEPMRNLCRYMDAINVDLKSFSEHYYRDICSGYLETVLDNLVLIKKEMGVWLELTNLVIPTLNDDANEARKMCAWISDNLGEDTPIHFSRFHPMYKLAGLPPTPLSTLENFKKIADAAGIKFAYIGNIPGHKAENTYCPNCKKALIRRTGYTILDNSITSGTCKFCQQKIPGIWT